MLKLQPKIPHSCWNSKWLILYGNITPEKARKSQQMQFLDKTAYVWGLRYRWTPFVGSRTLCHPEAHCCWGDFSETHEHHWNRSSWIRFAVFGSEWKWCHCVVWGLLPWQFRAGLWDFCFNLELMHTISLSLDFCDSRLFCTAVTMRDKLVKASFPASLGKALSVSTHHRSRSQDLLCCKSKLETFQLNVCLWTSTCCDKRKEMEKAPGAICLGSISAQLLNRSTTGCSTCRL